MSRSVHRLEGEIHAAYVIAVLIEAADREKGVSLIRAGDLPVETPLAVIGDADLTQREDVCSVWKYVDGEADLAVGQHLRRAAAHRLDMVTISSMRITSACRTRQPSADRRPPTRPVGT